MRLNELVSIRATVGRDDQRGGDERDAEDLHRGEDRQRRARASAARRRGPVRTPDASATSGSNVVNSSGGSRRTRRATTSDGDADDRPRRRRRPTPRMLPNRAASKLGPRRPNTANRARPSANDAVVITPIAASAPIARRRVTPLISSADARPHTPAPRKKFTPSSGAGGEAAEDGVRQPVADVAHALEHDEHADEPAQRAGERWRRSARCGRTRTRTGRSSSSISGARPAGSGTTSPSVRSRSTTTGMPACSSTSIRAP